LNFNSQKEQRLISAVKDVSQCRSLAKAKASCQDKELIAFKNTLKELAVLNINPVTIHREWNIKHIPNFLRANFTEIMREFSEFSNLDFTNGARLNPLAPNVSYSSFHFL